MICGSAGSCGRSQRYLDLLGLTEWWQAILWLVVLIAEVRIMLAIVPLIVAVIDREIDKQQAKEVRNMQEFKLVDSSKIARRQQAQTLEDVAAFLTSDDPDIIRAAVLAKRVGVPANERIAELLRAIAGPPSALEVAPPPDSEPKTDTTTAGNDPESNVLTLLDLEAYATDLRSDKYTMAQLVELSERLEVTIDASQSKAKAIAVLLSKVAGLIAEETAGE